ncbi:MAG: type II toxin-antitoxin system HicA family toxin [Candidatus Diapherotrites archaeon]|nr:type II toxin-antitoxin system HicA family toxin [Candidatus Diapherotrites archaeon]
MPKFPVVSGKEVIKALQKAGFEFISQKGSHVKLRKVDSSGKKTAIIPLRPVIRTGTMKSILRQAHMSIEELQNFL